MTPNKPSIVPPPSTDDALLSITKPGEFSLDKFKSKRAPAIAGVKTLLTALPHHKMSEAKDWVRLHSDELRLGADQGSEARDLALDRGGSRHATST